MKKITKIITVYDDGSTTVQDIYTAPNPLPTPWDPSTPYGPIKQSCPKCGIKLEGAMGYCCAQPQCPTGLGGAWCSATGDCV